MVNVPAQYQTLVQQMSNDTGIPYDVVAAQAQAESNFNPTARSSAGALGWLQFEPSTYSSYAAQAGVGPNTEFNPADEAKVYSVFMGSLLKQEHGNLRNALAAYNAGPGNIKAGLGYADSILNAAGQKGSTNVKTTGFPIPGIGSIPGLPSISISGVLGNALGDLRDVFERLGLILLGAALILMGIHMLTEGGSNSSAGSAAPSAPSAPSDLSRQPPLPNRSTKCPY
jgi:hypothetical protein